MIHMKYHVLLSINSTKKLKMLSAADMIKTYLQLYE